MAVIEIVIELKPKMKLCRFQNGDLLELEEIETGPASPLLEVKYQSPQRTIFLVRCSNRYKKDNAFLYQLDSSGVSRIEVEGLADVSIDPASGKKMAISYWNGEELNLAIKTLE